MTQVVALENGAPSITLGPERIVMTDGLQPFLLRTAAGTLVLQAQYSFAHNHIQPERNAFPGAIGTVLSRDNGASWERWVPTPDPNFMLAPVPRGYLAPFSGPVTEGASCALSDGSTMLLEWVADGPSSRGLWFGKLWESNDDFVTVAGPISMVIDLPQARCGFDDGGHPYGGLTFHRTLLQLPGGDLLAVAYCWFEGDVEPCPYMPSMSKFRTILLRSSDRGRHWSYVSTVAVDPAVGEEGFNEPVMVLITQGKHAGRLVSLLRTGCHDCNIYQTWSDDEGLTWSAPVKLPVCGVDPEIIELSDGTLLASFGWRTHNWREQQAPEFGNYVMYSRDAGESWTGLTKVPSDVATVDKHLTTCYTALREIAPNRVIMMYDIGAWGAVTRCIAAREISLGDNS